MSPHLCHVVPAFATGGPAVRTCLLINALGDAYRHTIVALDGNFSGKARLQRPDAIDFVPGPPRRGRLHHPLDLSRVLHALAPSLVLTYGWGGTDGILAARLAGFRRILHHEDGFLPEEIKKQKWARRWARRVLLNLAAGVVLPSQVLVRIARKLWKVPAARAHYVPNGIDLDRFTPTKTGEKRAARVNLGLPADELVVGSVGRLGPEKNQARLLRCFAAVAKERRARLVLVGDGPERGELLKLARDWGLEDRTHFLGTVVDPGPCYRALDVFALTSDTEQMPLSVLEAMAAGLPVVSTDVGDVKDMVAEGNKPWVVPACDEQALAGRLAELLDCEKTRHELGDANRRECARRFDLTTMIRAYDGLYRATMEN